MTRHEQPHLCLRAVFTACFGLLCFLSILIGSYSHAQAGYNPRYASIVMDGDTGMILEERHADKVLHPASLAKMMTLLLTFEALRDGKLRLRDRVPISRHAASMVPSKLDLPAGSSIRVEDAIYALVTKSANDVAVALGEKLGGSERHFARMMTKRARELGMTRTIYTNASGLNDPHQVTTARDTALLARALIYNHPHYYHYFSTRSFTYKGNTYRNHNHLMNSYRGMDGLKTGYISTSGFNLAASAVRDNQRIIGVVFGGRTSRSRNNHMKQLLDQGFNKMHHLMIASAANAPRPERKPPQAALYAALNSIEPAAGLLGLNSKKDATHNHSVKLAALSNDDNGDLDGDTDETDVNNIMQGSAFAEMVGEGDYDPAVSKRLETGLLAISEIKGQDFADKEFAKATNSAGQDAQNDINIAATTNPKPWAVQIGAFSSRVKTEKALQNATQALPENLADAMPIIVPLKTSEGWLFRARLSGFSKNEAQQACQHLPDCLPVSPRAY